MIFNSYCLKELSKAAIAVAIFAAIASSCFADPSGRNAFDQTQADKLVEKWNSSQNIAAILISGTYQRYRIVEGKSILDEDAVFTLLQEMRPPFRKKLSLSPERHQSGIVWERTIFRGPERSVVITTANGSFGKVNPMKMIKIYRPDAPDSDRNLNSLSFAAFLPAYRPADSNQWKPLTPDDFRNATVESNGSIKVSLSNRPGYQPFFWKTISGDGMRVLGYVQQGQALETEEPTWGIFVDATGEIPIKGFCYPKMLRLWHRLSEEWSLYNYNITSFEIKSAITEEELTPHFEFGYFVHDARTGVKFVIGDSPEKMINDIEMSLKERK